jgi:hypothetical protein
MCIVASLGPEEMQLAVPCHLFLFFSLLLYTLLLLLVPHLLIHSHHEIFFTRVGFPVGRDTAHLQLQREKGRNKRRREKGEKQEFECEIPVEQCQNGQRTEDTIRPAKSTGI